MSNRSSKQIQADIDGIYAAQDTKLDALEAEMAAKEATWVKLASKRLSGLAKNLRRGTTTIVAHKGPLGSGSSKNSSVTFMDANGINYTLTKEV
jgi:hypothetical protein